MHVILKRGEKTNEKNQINLIHVKLYVYVTLTVVSANSFSTGLSYTYNGSWRNGFKATLTENGGSPTTWKYVTGSYNRSDRDSGHITGYTNFTSPSKTGQFSWTKTISAGYSMNRVNCSFIAGDVTVGTRSL